MMHVLSFWLQTLEDAPALSIQNDTYSVSDNNLPLGIYKNGGHGSMPSPPTKPSDGSPGGNRFSSSCNPTAGTSWAQETGGQLGEHDLRALLIPKFGYRRLHFGYVGLQTFSVPQYKPYLSPGCHGHCHGTSSVIVTVAYYYHGHLRENGHCLLISFLRPSVPFPPFIGELP